jgi:hypothetical protein
MRLPESVAVRLKSEVDCNRAFLQFLDFEVGLERKESQRPGLDGALAAAVC